MSTRAVQRGFVLAAASAMAVVTVGTSGAYAGEITGNGKFKPVVANSICAFSGQNDGFHDPAEDHDLDDALIRVQSYGQIVRTGVQLPPFLRPGSACNGHTGFLAEP